MRFLLLLVVAMALTISWQTAALAKKSHDHDVRSLCAEDADKKKDENKSGGGDEPECE